MLIYKRKTAKPKTAIGELIRRDDHARNWVEDLSEESKTYY